MASPRPSPPARRRLAAALAGCLCGLPCAAASAEERAEPAGKGAGWDEPTPKRQYRPLVLPEPEKRKPSFRSPSPYIDYYTGRAPMFVGPGLRVAPGYAYRASGDTGSAFVLDVMSGAFFGLHPGNTQWVLMPEAGWTWSTPGARHQLTLGLGLGQGEGDSAPRSDERTLFGGFLYVPRLVFDRAAGQSSWGFRHGVVWDGAENTLALELSHLAVARPGGVEHEVRLNVSIDLGLLFLRAALD